MHNTIYSVCMLWFENGLCILTQAVSFIEASEMYALAWGAHFHVSFSDNSVAGRTGNELVM